MSEKGRETDILITRKRRGEQRRAEERRGERRGKETVAYDERTKNAKER